MCRLELLYSKFDELQLSGGVSVAAPVASAEQVTSAERVTSAEQVTSAERVSPAESLPAEVSHLQCISFNPVFCALLSTGLMYSICNALSASLAILCLRLHVPVHIH